MSLDFSNSYSTPAPDERDEKQRALNAMLTKVEFVTEDNFNTTKEETKLPESKTLTMNPDEPIDVPATPTIEVPSEETE